MTGLRVYSEVLSCSSSPPEWRDSLTGKFCQWLKSRLLCLKPGSGESPLGSSSSPSCLISCSGRQSCFGPKWWFSSNFIRVLPFGCTQGSPCLGSSETARICTPAIAGLFASAGSLVCSSVLGSCYFQGTLIAGPRPVFRSKSAVQCWRALLIKSTLRFPGTLLSSLGPLFSPSNLCCLSRCLVSSSALHFSCSFPGSQTCIRWAGSDSWWALFHSPHFCSGTESCTDWVHLWELRALFDLPSYSAQFGLGGTDSP